MPRFCFLLLSSFFKWNFFHHEGYHARLSQLSFPFSQIFLIALFHYQQGFLAFVFFCCPLFSNFPFHRYLGYQASLFFIVLFFKWSLFSSSKLSSTTFFPFFSCYLNWFFFIIIKVISLFFIFLLKSSFFKCSFSLRFWLYRCSFYIYIYIYYIYIYIYIYIYTHMYIYIYIHIHTLHTCMHNV